MVNTDYTFNGEPISESFVIEAAEVEGLSVDEYVNQKDGLEIVEVTDEIQTTPTKGKTNGVNPYLQRMDLVMLVKIILKHLKNMPSFLKHLYRQ